MSALRSALQKYVAMRRGFGFKFEGPEQRLRRFIDFMESHCASIVTYKLALQWATETPERYPSWAIRLADVRGFARYLQNTEAKTEVPPVGVFRSIGRSKPYIYSDTDLRKLLTRARALPPKTGLRSSTYYTFFGLLAVTGLRVGEAIRLHRDHVDLERGILTIRGTKFGKSRFVPLHPTACCALRRYAKRRDFLVWPPRSPHFFVAERGGQLLIQYVHRVFWRLSGEIGLRTATQHRGPRVHDFRHTFAVKTLLQCHRSGRSVEAMLPALATYLGHTTVRDTYWYLSACPELMHHASQKLESRWRGTL